MTKLSASRFIKWTQDTFQSGGHKAELLPLLERCTRELQGDARYKKDIRYLRVWIQYVSTTFSPPACNLLCSFLAAYSMAFHVLQADLLPEPRDIFSFLKVGHTACSCMRCVSVALLRVALLQCGLCLSPQVLCRSMTSARSLQCTTSHTLPSLSCAATSPGLRASTSRASRGDTGSRLAPPKTALLSFLSFVAEKTARLPELWLLMCRMAHPIERLRTKHEEFKHRMVRT